MHSYSFALFEPPPSLSSRHDDELRARLSYVASPLMIIVQALDQQRNESASSEDSKACGAGARMPKEMTAVSSMPLKVNQEISLLLTSPLLSSPLLSSPLLFTPRLASPPFRCYTERPYSAQDGMHTEESKEQAVHAELAGVVETKSDNGNRKRDMSDLSPATNGASSLKRQKSPGEADEGNNSPSSASLSTPASKKPRLTFGFGLRSVEKVVKTDDDNCVALGTLFVPPHAALADFKENGAESAPSISSDSRASLPENSEVKEDGVCEVVETNGTDELDVDVKEEENVEETIASFATSEVQVKEEEKQTDDRKEEEKNATEEVATKKESFPVLLEALSDSEDEAPMQEGSQPAGGDSVKSTQEEKPPEVKETAQENVPEEKPAEEEVSLTQEEILAKIQVGGGGVKMTAERCHGRLWMKRSRRRRTRSTSSSGSRRRAKLKYSRQRTPLNRKRSNLPCWP
eukprot:767693-Hanusia_phi.AAC.2